MIRDKQVPPEVVKRFATWQFPKCTDKLMRSMLADAINAWPGAFLCPMNKTRLILPLPQEGGDD